MSNAMQSEQINEFAAALAKAQGAMENAEKNKVNPHFKQKYADLAAIIDAIRLPLSSNGLAHTQTMKISERCLILRTTLFHTSGQFVASEYPIALGLKPQEMGSALTYFKRYSLAAIVGISSDDDDDGNVVQTAKPSATSTTNGNARISDDELTLVRAMVTATDSDISKLCQYYDIPKLEDITPDILPRVMAGLEKKKAQAHA